MGSSSRYRISRSSVSSRVFGAAVLHCGSEHGNHDVLGQQGSGQQTRI